MSDSKSKPATPKKSKLEIKPVEDLEPDEARGEDVRGGFGAGFVSLPGLPPKPSDAGLKNQVTPLRDALVRLHALRF